MVIVGVWLSGIVMYGRMTLRIMTLDNIKNNKTEQKALP